MFQFSSHKWQPGCRFSYIFFYLCFLLFPKFVNWYLGYYIKCNNHLSQYLFYFCDIIIYCFVSSYDLNNKYFSNFICYYLYYHHHHYSYVCVCMHVCIIHGLDKERPRCRGWRATCRVYLFLYLMCVPQVGLRSPSVWQAPWSTKP